VITDYGVDKQPEADVAALVLSLAPDFVITTGDNNDPRSSDLTIDQNIGQYYHSFIYPYQGSYGAGAEVNRFFPAMGNHDWHTSDGQPYLDYFTLPGNERYYDFTWGMVHLFSIDSVQNEPDGVTGASAQAAWLQQALAASTATWQIVYFHHPPYSSGLYGPIEYMQWPFKEWGADAVLAGHEHNYERMNIGGMLYLVTGSGGDSLYPFGTIISGSQVRYNQDYGAMLVEATREKITFWFYTRQHTMIDEYTLWKNSP
jgi:tartrate-resistant acid phosphatase type 5